MGKSHQCCGTCAYWNGERMLDAVNHGYIANIISQTAVCTCRASSKCKTNVAFDKTCLKWEKWPNLR